MTAIFSPVHNEKVIKKLAEQKIPITKVNCLWANSSKTFVDKAELVISQSLRVPAVVTNGIMQALTLHDMEKQFVFVGLIEKNVFSEDYVKADTKKIIAEKLIPILGLDLAAPAKEAKKPEHSP